MSTHQVSIMDCLLPDTSGNVFWEPSPVKDANDRYPREVLIFNDTATALLASGRFRLPKNYVSAPVIRFVWKATATSGDVRFTFAYTAVGGDVAESMDPSADQEAVAVTDTASGTARRKTECSVALTAGNFSATDDEVLFSAGRDGTSGADTMAAALILEDLIFEYADA